MKELRGFLVAFLLVLASLTPFETSTVSARVGGGSKPNQESTYSWVFAVYMDGDNELESAAIGDFLEISSVGSTDDVAMVVLFDRWNGTGQSSDDTSYGDWTDARIFIVDSGETPDPANADAVWGEVDMGDYSTLYNFLVYVVENFDASHYALVIWDHGASFYGAAIDYDNFKSMLTLREIADALRLLYENYGVRLDIIGFDACLMGTIEVAYGLIGLADIVVFSEELEPDDGWPYDDILSFLVSNPGVSPENLASKIVDYYTRSYSGIWPYNYPYATLSAVNLSSLGYAIPKINRVVGYLLRNYGSLAEEIDKAINDTETFSVSVDEYKFQKDLIHFMILLRDYVDDSELDGLLTEAVDAINKSIIREDHLSGHPNASGIAAVFRDSDYLSLIYYSSLSYSTYQQWDEFVLKINGRSPDVWFYDIEFHGNDSDKDGLFDSDMYVVIDLDSSYEISLYVEVYAQNGREALLAKSPNVTISGATDADKIMIPFYMLLNGTVDLSFRIVSTNGRTLKWFGVLCDDDVIDLPVEPVEDSVPPTITILSPANHTEIHSLNVSISLVVEDNYAISNVEVYLNGSLVGNYSEPPNEISISLPSYGVYNITIVAYDIAGNVARVMLIIKATRTEFLRRYLGIIIIAALIVIMIIIILHRRRS